MISCILFIMGCYLSWGLLQDVINDIPDIRSFCIRLVILLVIVIISRMLRVKDD